MKTAIKVFGYTIKENATNPTLIFMMLIFPIILILILGNALSGFYKQTELPKMNIIMVNQISSFDVYNSILKNDQAFAKLFNVETSNSKTSALKKFSATNKYAALIIFKEKTNKYKDYSPWGNFDIEIISKEGLQESIFVKLYFSIFVNYYKFAKNTDVIFNSIKPVDFLSAFSGAFPRAIDYYAVTMVVMMALYGSFGGIAVIEEERRQNTLIRIFCSPANPQIVFVSRAIAQTIFLYLQLCIIVLFSKYIFHANFGKQLLIVFLLLFMISIFSILIGILATILFKNFTTSSIVVSSFAVISTFLSGGYVKIDISQKFLSFIRDVLPNYVVQSAIFTAIYNPNEMTYIKNAFIYLSILILFILFVCIILIKKVKICQY